MAISSTVIHLAKDFSKYPGGRLKADGPKSGQAFREDLLVPALKSFDRVEVDLSGVVGLPSSFLEEAFGGAVALLGFDVVDKKLKLTVTDDPFAESEIRKFMVRASGRA